jgi:hypothetical protein
MRCLRARGCTIECGGPCFGINSISRSRHPRTLAALSELWHRLLTVQAEWLLVLLSATLHACRENPAGPSTETSRPPTSSVRAAAASAAPSSAAASASTPAAQPTLSPRPACEVPNSVGTRTTRFAIIHKTVVANATLVTKSVFNPAFEVMGEEPVRVKLFCPNGKEDPLGECAEFIKCRGLKSAEIEAMIPDPPEQILAAAACAEPLHVLVAVGDGTRINLLRRKLARVAGKGVGSAHPWCSTCAMKPAEDWKDAGHIDLDPGTVACAADAVVINKFTTTDL